MAKTVDILEILSAKEVNIFQRALKSQDVKYSPELENKEIIECLEIFQDYLCEEAHVIRSILNELEQENSTTLDNLKKKKEKHIQEHLLCDDIIWKIKMLNC